MNWIQKTLLWIGISVIVVMGLFPPWVVGKSVLSPNNAGYNFILNPPEAKRSEFSGLNSSRLLVQWIMVAVITGGFIVTFKSKKKR